MVGVVAEGLEQAGSDTILDFDITSNRPDCLSHFGVAREVATRYQKALKRCDDVGSGVDRSGCISNLRND